MIHESVHCPIQMQKCSECEKEFKSIAELQKHKKTHCSATKNHKCDFCGKKYSTKSVLQQHYIIHTGEKPFKCEICGKTFNSKSGLCNHKTTHVIDGKRYKCHLCEKSFSRNGGLKQHYMIHTGEKPFVCEVCGCCFTKKVTLIDHMKTHGTIYGTFQISECSECGKKFKTKNGMIKHKKKHFKETEVYNCEFCDKNFFERTSLKRHYLIHTGEKPFECEICGKRFNVKSSIVSHAKIHDITIPSSIQTKNSECGEEYKSVLGPLGHKKTHSKNTKVNVCDLCGKIFVKRSALKQHYLIHTGEKPFECEICGKKFNRKSLLVSHIKTHEIAPFPVDICKCSECGKEFRSSSGLFRHKKNKHLNAKFVGIGLIK